jgi:adhesin transport system membrane fusion protein
MNIAPIVLDPVRGPQKVIITLLLTISGLMLFLLIWSSFAHLDITAVGEGTVVPSSHIQVVQNLEGGILRDVLVREGDHVKEGDVVAQIDDTGMASSYHEDLSTYQALQATAARLTAEAQGTDLSFPDSLVNAPEGAPLIKAETALYQSRLSGLEDSIDVFRQQEDQANQTIAEAREKLSHLEAKKRSALAELKIVTQQVNAGVMSVVPKLQLERLIAETDEAFSDANGKIHASEISLRELAARIAEKRSQFVSDAREDLAKRKAEMAALSQRLIVHRDKMGRREVRAPANGIVKRVATLTSGAVIEPGGTIMEIVPADDTLLIEAKISPSDIAFIHAGQDAKVRVTAYDFSVYGALPAHVERVGADTQTTPEGVRYYPVTVRVDQKALDSRQAHLPIIPGMLSQVSVITGQRSVIGYLLKPVLKLKDDALQER